jgi:G:T-mismatch repair DNA endonuclease (very short patch repair protein)
VKQTLKKQGWKIIEVWECEVKAKRAERRLKRIVEELKKA